MARTIAVTFCLPVITVIVGFAEKWRAEKAQKSENARIQATQIADKKRQESWDAFLNQQSLEREKTNLAMKMTESLASKDNDEDAAERVILLALCFASTSQLDANIIHVLTFYQHDKPEFRNRLLKGLLLMKAAITEESAEQKDKNLLSVITKAINRLDTSGQVGQAASPGAKKTIIEDAIQNPELLSVTDATTTARVAASDSDLKKDQDIKDKTTTVLKVTLDRATSSGSDAVGVQQVIEASLKPDLAKLPEVQTVFESAARDVEKVKPEQRVEIVEKALGKKKRLVLVYSRPQDESRVKTLAAWGESQGLVVSVWNTKDIGRVVQQPSTINLRFRTGDSAAEDYAKEILPKINEKLGTDRASLAATSSRVIAANEYEIWFPK